MSVHFQGHGVTLHHGDCRDILATIPDGSVHAVVCDPPYELGFMGKGWDASGIAYDVDVWREVFRTLKPGGHLLAFGGTRTWHRLACAVEDAGFEIRDSIAWLYGSGFPKSHDVSKAIDKQRNDVDDVRRVCRWLRARIDEHPEHSLRTIAAHFGFHSRMVDHWAARDTDSQPNLPTLDQWDTLRDLLGFDESCDAEVFRLNLRKGEPGEAWADRPVTGTVAEWENRTAYALTSRDGLRRDTPATDAARQWEGWGTALKPAHEPVVVARKPLTGTVAANVQAHGTGALNIDACRIGTTKATPASPSGVGGYGGNPNGQTAQHSGMDANVGRWPANVILDDDTAAHLDEQSGTLTSGANPKRRGADGDRTAYGDFAGQADANPQRGVDTGGASRFFYVAKAPKRERPSYLRLACQCEGPQPETVPAVRAEGDTCPDCGAGVVRFSHPTVKPLSLMRQLTRLVTPPGGTVLEVFAGSGTEVEACIAEGFDVIAIERGGEYLPLIRERIRRQTEGEALPEAAELTRTTDQARAIAEQVAGQLDIFGEETA